MIATIVQSAVNFCKHQLTKECTVLQKAPHIPKIFIASIEILQNDKTYDVLIGIEKGLLQTICELFLFEEESDDACLQDMLLETTNMIVGSAKTLAQKEKRGHKFTIATPTFIGYSTLPATTYMQQTALQVDAAHLFIAIKEKS
jgi:CheY-specific phosphatase CheX